MIKNNRKDFKLEQTTGTKVETFLSSPLMSGGGQFLDQKNGKNS